MKKQTKMECFNSAINWIAKYSIDNSGIAVNSLNRKIYPEVTGYFIPTLLYWGEKERACDFAKYLCSIQQEDGSWMDPDGCKPYVFDSAQVLKGLLAVRELMPEVDNHILKGCDWIASNVQDDGRLTTPDQNAWGDDEDFCSELVHIYCIEPIKRSGVIFNRNDYIDIANSVLAYYKREKIDKIKNFSLLSHFYAYVLEGLYDLGEVDLCREAMTNLEKYKNKKNGIPGLKDVPWVCSTGLFQLAIVWYKLGELDKGNELFNYALSLQNKSGGWYGSYPAPGLGSRFYRGKNKPYYFPKAEISWAVKYFLDALALKEKLEFEAMAHIFSDEIDENDGRYKLIDNTIADSIKSNNCENSDDFKVLDVGCGKGRYLKKLTKKYSNQCFCATDISETVMKNIDYVSEKRVGGMTCIPYEDGVFDVVYAIESFEHAINQRAAFKELYRVTRDNGCFVVIDKPVEKLGKLELYDWEQWISDDDMMKYTEECGGRLKIIKSVPYGQNDDGLFRAWIVYKNH